MQVFDTLQLYTIPAKHLFMFKNVFAVFAYCWLFTYGTAVAQRPDKNNVAAIKKVIYQDFRGMFHSPSAILPHPFITPGMCTVMICGIEIPLAYHPESGVPIINKGFQNRNYLVLNMIACLEKRKTVSEFCYTFIHRQINN